MTEKSGNKSKLRGKENAREGKRKGGDEGSQLDAPPNFYSNPEC